MKKRVILMICLLLAASTVAGPLPAGAQDLRFLGNYCWTEPDGGTIRLGVSLVGPGHLQINGGVYLPTGPLDGVLSGNGEIASDGIHLVLSQSATGDTFISGILHVVLDRKTLNGTAEAVLHYYDKAAVTLDTVYDTRPLTKITCP